MADPGQDAIERFYEVLWPYRADVLRMARILCGNDSDAEDLAQETLLRACAEVDGFDDATSARTWLIRALRRTRVDRGLRSVEADEHPDKPSPESATDWANPGEKLDAFSNQELIDALQDVPEEIRWVLLLLDVQQLEQQEVADVLDLPLEAVVSRADLGRGILRRTLLSKTRRRVG